MTLDSYLAAKNLTEPAFAERAKIDQSTVNRLRRGGVPSTKVMRAIIDATGGEVTPNDFYGIVPVKRRARTAQVAA